MSWRSIPAIVLVLCAVGTQAASAGWAERETVGSDINGIYLAPGGPGFVSGFGASNPSRLRYALRPLDGAVGTVTEFPGASGVVTGRIPLPYFDAAGNAIIANEDTRHVAYRSADGTKLFDETLNQDAQNRPKLVSVAPTGEALIGMQGSTPTGVIKVAFRPAGATAPVDEESAASFDTASVLIGLLLQADGGAIVVWQKNDTLFQSVRPSGASLFTTPTEIPQPGDPRKSLVQFDGDPSGNAMLSWYGSTTTGGGFRSDRALATVRTHDGSFGPATVLDTSPVAGGIVNVVPAMTSKGVGIASWRHVAGDPSCLLTTIRGSIYQAGAFAPAAYVAGSASPLFSIPSYLPVSSGDRIAIPVLQLHDPGTPCAFSDDTRSLSVRHYTGTSGGLVDNGTTELAPVELRDDGVTKQPFLNAVDIEPAGKLLAWFQVDGARYLRSFDGVVPAATGGTEPPAGSPTTGSPTTGEPGLTPVTPPTSAPAKPLLPIVPQRFVTVKPIDPALLTAEFKCVATPDELCGVDYWVYYMFTGKYPSPASAAASKAKPKQLTVAHGFAKLRGGQRKTVKLKLTKVGRKILRLRRKLTIVVETRVKIGDRSATSRVKSTLKAPKPKRGGRAGP